jgi:ATP-dependent RNA helicase DOB1
MDLKPAEERNHVFKSIMEVKKRFPEGIPQLDPIENMGIKDEGFKKLVRVSVASKCFSFLKCR